MSLFAISCWSGFLLVVDNHDYTSPSTHLPAPIVPYGWMKLQCSISLAFHLALNWSERDEWSWHDEREGERKRKRETERKSGKFINRTAYTPTHIDPISTTDKNLLTMRWIWIICRASHIRAKPTSLHTKTTPVFCSLNVSHHACLRTYLQISHLMTLSHPKKPPYVDILNCRLSISKWNRAAKKTDLRFRCHIHGMLFFSSVIAHNLWKTAANST